MAAQGKLLAAQGQMMAAQGQLLAAQCTRIAGCSSRADDGRTCGWLYFKKQLFHSQLSFDMNRQFYHKNVFFKEM